jgi:hypothetical protein
VGKDGRFLVKVPQDAGVNVPITAIVERQAVLEEQS